MAARAHWFDDETPAGQDDAPLTTRALATRHAGKPLRLRRRVTTDLDGTLDDAVVDANEEEPETGPCAAAWSRANGFRRSKCFALSSVPTEFCPRPCREAARQGNMVECLPGCDRRRGCEATRWGVPERVISKRDVFWRERPGVGRPSHGRAWSGQSLRSSCHAGNGVVRRIGDLLGLARRAGQAIAGFEKARDWMEAGRCGLVLQARMAVRTERARFGPAVPETVPVRRRR